MPLNIKGLRQSHPWANGRTFVQVKAKHLQDPSVESTEVKKAPFTLLKVPYALWLLS